MKTGEFHHPEGMVKEHIELATQNRQVWELVCAATTHTDREPLYHLAQLLMSFSMVMIVSEGL